MRSLETRRPLPGEVGWRPAEPLFEEERQLPALLRQVAVERGAKQGIPFDPVVQSVNEPGDHLPAAERLKRSYRRKQRCIARTQPAPVTEVGLNPEWD